MPELFIITGSNGAGKSSVGPIYLPEHIRQIGPVFDGDKLFVEKRNQLWRDIKSPKECSRLAYEFVSDTFDQLVEQAISRKANFAYEGHFTNESTWEIPRRFKSEGYTIHLIFLGLKDTDLSQLRVVERSKSGGHYVDPPTVKDNFYGNLEKLNKHYGMFHTVQIIDTSEIPPILLVQLNNSIPIEYLPKNSIPDWFKKYLPSIFSKI